MKQDRAIDIAVLQTALEAYAAKAGDEPRFPRLLQGTLSPVLREAVTIDPNPILIGRTLYERMWVIINRGVRRVIRHAAEPAVRQQNDFNTATLHALNRLIAADATLHGTIIRLRAERHRHDD